jgi:hypothetical protein
MSAGCLIVGSATPPVMEVLQNRRNGLLVDFFAVDQICDRVDEVLDSPDRLQTIREAARAEAIAAFLPRCRPTKGPRPWPIFSEMSRLHNVACEVTKRHDYLIS